MILDEFSGKAVLIVEDQVDIAEAIRMVFKQAILDVQIASSVTAALEALRSLRFSAILLDLVIPNEDSWAVLRAANALKPKIPVIVMTGLGDERIAAKAFRQGACDYMIKTLDFYEQLPAALLRAFKLSEANETLCAQEMLLHAVVKGTTDAIFIKDCQRRYLVVNNAAAQLIGRDAKEIIGSTDHDLLPHENAERIAEDDNRCLQTGESLTFSEEMDFATGKTVLLTTKSPIWDDKNQIAGLIGVARDVTELKRTEEVLRINERHFRSALEAAKMSAWQYDGALDRVNFDERGLEFMGLDRDRPDGTYAEFLALLHADDRATVEEAVAKSMAKAVHYRTEFRVPQKDGSMRWLATNGHAYIDPGSGAKRMLGVMWDISERKKSEERMLQAEKINALGQLAGGVAHDFNNQLSIILGYCEMLEQQLQESDPKRFVRNILTATQRSAALTKNLLAFARKGQYQKTPVNIHRILAETTEMLERSLDKKIVIVQDLKAHAPVTLGDPSQLQNALLNLAINARDAMPNGGVLTFSTENVLRADLNGAAHSNDLNADEYIRINVRDTGTGMSDEVQRHLFEPYFTTKPVGKGTGMGLASVYGTVKNHKGAVQVHSQLGRGTTFKVYLPVERDTAAALPPKIKNVRSLKKLRILLVDDEEIVRSMLSYTLSSRGHMVREAFNGRDAVEIYKRHWNEIDLVILDMIMPEMNGSETFREMKKLNPRIKALVSSGYSQEEVQAILDEGVTGFIEKPFEQHRLDALLERVAT